MLLLGASGQLGSELVRARGSHAVIAPSHAEAPIENSAVIAALLREHKPKVVVNCAAFHNVDRCEEEADQAFLSNAIAVDRIASLCDEIAATFVTISTDYVFDGAKGAPYTESDAPHPLSTYGISKYAGELLVRRHAPCHLIVRTCGVYGVRPSATKGHTFIDRIITQARGSEEIRVVDDVIASPTYARHLAQALLRLIDIGASGIVHVANTGAVSWHAFATEALRQAGITHPIRAIGSGDWKAKAIRPTYSALVSDRLGAYGIEMPSWHEGIRDYLADREARTRLP